MSNNDNIGMELNRNEAWLDTPIDKEKVTDIVKKFDGEKIMKATNEYISERKKKLEDARKNRTVETVCTSLADLFSPKLKDDVNSYYTSYDDHLAKLNDEIENQKASIMYGFERLKLLIEKEEKLRAEAGSVTSENFVLPKNLAVEGFEGLIKEHIFHKHPKLVGDYYGEHRFSSHAGPLHLEKIYDEDGDVVKVRCVECYRKFMKEADLDAQPTKDDGEMDLHDHVGGKI